MLGDTEQLSPWPDDTRRTVADVFAEEKPGLLSPPVHPFVAELVRPVKQIKGIWIAFDLNHYTGARGLTRRQRAAAETRQRILAAARSLFAEKGFDAVTTEQIADAAEVAKGTLFLHARTKERLLLTVYEDELGAALRHAVARPPRGGTVAAALTAVFRRFFKVHERDPALARRFVAHLMLAGHDESPGLRAVQDDALRGLAALIGERRERGEVAPDVDVALAAGNSFLIYYGVLAAWLSGWLPSAAARDRMLADGLALHWRGLEGPRSPERRR